MEILNVHVHDAVMHDAVMHDAVQMHSLHVQLYMYKMPATSTSSASTLIFFVKVTLRAYYVQTDTDALTRACGRVV